MADPTPELWWECSSKPCSHVPLESCYTSMCGGLVSDSFVCFIIFNLQPICFIFYLFCFIKVCYVMREFGLLPLCRMLEATVGPEEGVDGGMKKRM
jgi:hypothetical protein